MNRIDKAFKLGKKEGRPLFISYIMAGDPCLEETQDLVLALEKAGADLVELGIPFSDPIADGVVNQKAGMRAIESGTTLKKVLETVALIRQRSQIPIVLFSYLNPITQFGVESFSTQAAEAGVDGVLALDLPPEESKSYHQAFKKAGLKTIYLATPTTPIERIQKIGKQTSGFLYYVSRLGVTGVEDRFYGDLKSRVQEIKEQVSLPIAVGFGVSQPAHIQQLAPFSDAIVVGSAIVKQIEEAQDKESRLEKVTQLVQSLTKELKNG